MVPEDFTAIRTELIQRGLMDEEGNINHTRDQKKAHRVEIWTGRKKLTLTCPRCGCNELVEKRDGTIRCPSCEYQKLREIIIKANLRQIAISNPLEQ